MTRVFCRFALAVFLLASIVPAVFAQPSPRALLAQVQRQSVQTHTASPAVTRRGIARIDALALLTDRIELSLFDDVRVVARRTSRTHVRQGSTLWSGTIEAPDQGEVILASVDGVLAGSITIDGRLFEIGFAGSGLHEVRELNPALFPAEDSPETASDLMAASGSGTVSSSVSSSDATSGQIDVMIVWTPAARNAAGGTTPAIQSVVDLALANANAAYVRSNVPASLRLVYSGEVDYLETPSGISTDLSRLRSTTDGYIDQAHSLRNQYGADIVTLFGSGYSKAGYCGIGYLMSTVSTSFAGSAFNVVDQSCAASNLSYAHEVGHNQGLHHDPLNAGSTPSYPYAYGYQDSAGAFRTVMAYGSAVRVQQMSNPSVFYSGKTTGTASQNNAEALARNAAMVASFRSLATQTCTYTVTPTSMAFSDDGGTATVQVETQGGCSWTTAGTSWVTVGPGGSGPGSVLVSVAPNTGAQRTATITLAGVSVSISEAAAGTEPSPSCSYVLSETAITVPSTGGTVDVLVATDPGCNWTASSSTGWLKVTGGGTGTGSATLQVNGTSGGSRAATAIVAGQTVTVRQSGAPRKK